MINTRFQGRWIRMEAYIMVEKWGVPDSNIRDVAERRDDVDNKIYAE